MSVPARADRARRVPTIEPLEARQLLSAALPQFNQTNLVSDGATPAQHTDPNLVNPWGVAITNTGAIWVADNGTGVTTLYDQNGNPSPPVVTIPTPAGAAPGSTSSPSGAVFNNAGKAFDLPNTSTPAKYVFVTEDGTVSAWDPSIGNSAALVADNSGSGAVYKGLAIAGKGKKAQLYAANFSAGTVDVFDSNFKPVTLAAGAFTDPSIPAGFAPFNVQNVGNKLYVTYAMQDATKQNDVAGVGNGFVDVFSASGKMIRRLASAGPLDSPWGVTRLPGRGGDIAVGNFGDGAINVFSASGKSLGALMDASNQPITIDRLWALTPGVGSAKNTLFFSAGTNDEADGLFGTLTAQKAAKAKSAGTGSGNGNGAGSGTGTGSGNSGGFNYGSIASMGGMGGTSSASGMGGGSSTAGMGGAGSTLGMESSSSSVLGMSGMSSMSSMSNMSNMSNMSSASSIVGTGSTGTESLSGVVGMGSINSVFGAGSTSQGEQLSGVVGMGSINGVIDIDGLASIAGAPPIIM
jgi:uncharacterized protein (TIGR03118 family)